MTIKKKHSSSKNNEDNVRHLNMDNPKNWTKEKLLSEIQRIGIKVPSNLKVNALIQIYNDNKKDSSIVPSENLINVAETPAALIGLGAKLKYMGYFASLLHPPLPPPGEEKFGCYLESGTCLGGLETHVLLSYLWSFFCKWLVTTVTLVTLKNEVYEIQDQNCFVKPYK